MKDPWGDPTGYIAACIERDLFPPSPLAAFITSWHRARPPLGRVPSAEDVADLLLDALDAWRLAPLIFRTPLGYEQPTMWHRALPHRSGKAAAIAAALHFETGTTVVFGGTNDYQFGAVPERFRGMELDRLVEDPELAGLTYTTAPWMHPDWQQKSVAEIMADLAAGIEAAKNMDRPPVVVPMSFEDQVLRYMRELRRGVDYIAPTRFVDEVSNVPRDAWDMLTTGKVVWPLTEDDLK